MTTIFAGGSPAAGYFFLRRQEKVTKKKAPRTRTRASVEREGAQAAARNTVKRGAHAAAPAPQASLTVSRQPPVCRPFGVPSVLKEKEGLRNSPLRGSNSARPLLRFLFQNLGGAQGVFQERKE